MKKICFVFGLGLTDLFWIFPHDETDFGWASWICFGLLLIIFSGELLLFGIV